MLRVQHRAPVTRFQRSSLGYERTLSTVGQTEMAVGGVVATIPGAQLVGALIMLGGLFHTILGKIFGPSPYNVPAAQAEQVFEAAADNLLAVARAGMITREQAAAAMQEILSNGAGYISSLGLKDPGKQAIANMTRTIQAEIAAAQSLPAVASKPIDLAAARALYVNAAGWYPGSTAQGAQLTDAYLQNLAAQPEQQVKTAVSELKQLVSGVPSWALALGALAAAWGIYEAVK